MIEHALLLFIFNIWVISIILFVAYKYDDIKTREEKYTHKEQGLPCSLCRVCEAEGYPYNPDTYCRECAYKELERMFIQ